ncbi:MAG: AIPR family protein [Planctomycetes bacterium]|nr:AIPR family protein [Planctomycetota bacterium]
MADMILASHLKDFATQNDLQEFDDSQLFAYFVANCALSRLTAEALTLGDFDVDGSHDTGLDTVAILVNGYPVTSIDEIDFFRDKLRRFDVDFVFVQSKTSPKFNAAEIGSFAFGVKQFFSQEASIPTNDAVASYRELKAYIYENSIHMANPPACHLFYATTGEWRDDPTVVGRMDSERNELKATGLFSDVHFQPLDSERLKTSYRELRHKVEREINFDKHTILPSIEGVDEAYLGYVPAREFLDFISDEDGNLLKSLFYDNVRDFQGDNPVNREIADTLGNPNERGRFVLLNNGITIVARSINKVAAKFRVTDYQIVNGCQTCNVLHLNRHDLTDQVFLPIKLIVTGDAEVTNEVIKATNRQTEVKLEAFESLAPFHRKLEDFYASFDKDSHKRLYYERRSKQYQNLPVKPHQIISLATQSKSFLAMFLNQPHSTPRYYGEILNTNRERMFLDKHSPFPYYTAGYALHLVDSLFKTNAFPYWFRRFKYYMMMLLRRHVGGPDVLVNDNKNTDKCCQTICDVLWDREKAKEEFSKTLETIKTALNSFTGVHRLAHRLRHFTAELTPELKNRPTGTVTYYNIDRGFGFIAVPQHDDVFVHYTQIKGVVEHRYLRDGERVEFDLVKTDKGPQAHNVSILPPSS